MNVTVLLKKMQFFYPWNTRAPQNSFKGVHAFQIEMEFGNVVF